MSQQIPCPVCKTAIVIDTQQLLLGMQFACSGCGGTLALTPASKPVVSHAIDQMNALRKGTGARGA